MDVSEYKLCVPQPRHTGAQLRGEARAGQETEGDQTSQHKAVQGSLEVGQTGINNEKP